MDIPTDLPGVLSEFGLPVGAVAVSYGLIKGAEVLEKDASDDALRYISRLLNKGSLTSFGALGAVVIPLIFDKAFGQKPLTARFILRSALASILFWTILIIAKRHDLTVLLGDHRWIIIAPIILIVDWLSLTKARLILRFMSNKRSVVWAVVFVIADILVTYLLLFALTLLFVMIIGLFAVGIPGTLEEAKIFTYQFINDPFAPVLDYLRSESINDISQVFPPSTLLTSVWVILFLISSAVAELLAPLEYIRRLTIWWFKDIDAHPLTVIAKVAATLIVIGAFVLKAGRWGWQMV